MSPRLRTFLVWVLLIVCFFGIYMVLQGDDSSTARQPAAVFYSDFEAGRVRSVTVDHLNRIYADLDDGRSYPVEMQYTQQLSDELNAASVIVGWHEEEPTQSARLTWIIVAAGAIVILAVLYLVYRRVRQAGGGVLALRKTTARLVSETPKVGWADVGGAVEAKAYLRDTVDFLAHPAKWEAAGARAPRGILLEGPPGFGKTMLAKALAGEAKLPFFEVSGAEFVELFVGVGAARVRDLFDSAKQKAPCVVFIDEIDAIGRRRGGAGASLTHQEREQTLDQLLVCLDGFTPRARVVVVAATNRADVLDPALLRPGRFDITLRVGDFTIEDRVAVLGLHASNKPLAKGVDLAAIAALASEASGADLEQICNAAAMIAVRRGPPITITQADLEKAVAGQAPKSTQLDKLDIFLASASTGVAQPSASFHVSVHLRGGGAQEGVIIWADPLSLKLNTAKGGTLLSRAEIVSITAITRIEAIGKSDLLRVAAPEQPDAG